MENRFGRFCSILLKVRQANKHTENITSIKEEKRLAFSCQIFNWYSISGLSSSENYLFHDIKFLNCHNSLLTYKAQAFAYAFAKLICRCSQTEKRLFQCSSVCQEKGKIPASWKFLLSYVIRKKLKANLYLSVGLIKPWSQALDTRLFDYYYNHIKYIK